MFSYLRNGNWFCHVILRSADFSFSGEISHHWSLSEEAFTKLLNTKIKSANKTADLVKYLKDNGILTTGIFYPVVPKGDDEIRFQICADHTRYDIDYVLKALREFRVNCRR